MKEKAKIRKAVYIAVMWCILASVLLGCRKSNVESYASAEEAKQAMSQCRTFLVEGDLDEVNQEGNILADGKIAGRLKETGILNTKWTVSVDGKTWFWMKFVTDEPINNIDGVIAGTTYGYYDETISAWAMHRSGCSRTKIWNVNIISYLWMQTEIQKIIWQKNAERNFTITRAIRSAAEKQNSRVILGRNAISKLIPNRMYLWMQWIRWQCISNCLVNLMKRQEIKWW